MTLSAIKDAIIEKIAELGEIETHEVSEERALRDLGIDSLMAIELVVFIERILHRSFPEEKMGTIQTCADVFREAEILAKSAA